MDFEFWWLLVLALFFAMGWLAARIDIRHVVRESRALPMSYFKGLNFLLNEQPDKAIEAFNEVVRVKPETVELHFALGSLFRRQGEVDARSACIRTCSSGRISRDKRLTALYEIGQDYQRAGLLDRAEEAYLKLEGTTYEHQALDRLLQIYEQEKDWLKAIAVTKKIEALTKVPYFKEIAHYYCELGSVEMLQSASTRRTIISIARSPSTRPACGRHCWRATSRSRRTVRRRDCLVAADRIAESGISGLAAEKLRDAT
jgi:lipopolysaccharide biosynthesis regulator YciM